MKITCKFLLFLIVALFPAGLSGQTRSAVNICNKWIFQGSNIYGDSVREIVNLPHTWNNKDAQAGFSYYRGTGTYTKKIFLDKKDSGKRLFVKFEGAHTVADVWFNGVYLGQHRGGYSAFVFEVTSHARFGEDNSLVVKVDNLYHNDVLPLGGDFNMYGGLYRPVYLLITEQVCITPLDYASPGVYIKQLKVTDSEANLEITSKLSNGSASEQPVIVTASVFDLEGKLVTDQKSIINIAAGDNSELKQLISIPNPKLWNGRSSPYLYKVKIQISSGNKVIDEVTQPLGLRSFTVDPEKGFILNGVNLALHGVSRHQDKRDKGSALSEEDHRTDIQIIADMGVNSLRLAHYQQSGFFYSLCDSAGMIVWAEIPFVGSLMTGYNNNPSFHQNAKQQLVELIRQNYNHPSICFWGLFNELSNPKKDSPVPLVKELNALARHEDPTRLTTGASFLADNNELSFITDVVDWNKYFGWYYGKANDLGKWADKLHARYPKLRFGISEYGAGASVNQHEDYVRRPFPVFTLWHPEEWQALNHEQSWAIINERPFIWSSFVWTMFDFSSSFRNEGEEPGINDKGLVTYDRKTKKDAYFLYKVHWNTEPMIHLNDKRFRIHKTNDVNVKIYSNLDSVELFVNNKSLWSAQSTNKIFIWKHVKLEKGNNIIKATGKSSGQLLQDECVWMYKPAGLVSSLVWFLQYGIIPFSLLTVILVPVLYFRAFKRKNALKRKTLNKILFFLFALFLLILLILIVAGLKYGVSIFDYSVL